MDFYRCTCTSLILLLLLLRLLADEVVDLAAHHVTSVAIAVVVPNTTQSKYG